MLINNQVYSNIGIPCYAVAFALRSLLMGLVGFISILLFQTFTDAIQTCLNSQVLPEAETLLL